LKAGSFIIYDFTAHRPWPVLQVLDIALLFETGAYRLTWPRVLVACDAETQLQRLMARDASGAVAARARMEAQMPLEAKRKLADVVIDNSGSLADTREQAGPVSWIPSKHEAA
jgi:dephospho-CoA kinase